MDTLTVSACGDKTWNWPCIHLDGATVVDLALRWKRQDDTPLPLPDTGSGGEGVLLYLPALCASRNISPGSAAISVEDGAAVVREFNPAGLRGVYEASARWTDESGAVRLALPCLISVRNDLFGSASAAKSVCLEDLRMFLYDRLPSENLADGAQEFPDRLLFEGLAGALRQWRDAVPGNRSVSSQSAVDRNMLIMGSAGWALRSYRGLLARNAMQSAGQTTLEAGRLQSYDAMGKEYYDAFARWLSERVRADDFAGGFRTV